MVAFIKQEYEKIQSELWLPSFADDVSKYANFLSKTLEIWQFVPCKLVEGVWVVLEEKKPFQDHYYEWEEAKDRCYFEGFELITKPNGNRYIQKNQTIIFFNTEEDFDYRLNVKLKTIEDLLKYNLELTPTGQKESGLI